jgi:catechol 2,3-dioxygenase-like lactoylglutathione lyase family enzyme
VRIEHAGYNVSEPRKMAAWYEKHLGFTTIRSGGEPNYAQFIADESGGVMVEIYHNAACPVPDYASQDPLVFHLALISHDVAADVDRLTAAGATIADPIKQTAGGDTLCMLRDPWGVPLQLCQRTEPMVR